MNTLWIALVASVALVSSEGSAAEPSANARSAERSREVWIASTRELSAEACREGSRPNYWRFAPDATWTPDDETALFSSSLKAMPMVVFIHGNRWDADRAAIEGLEFWKQLSFVAPEAKFRFVIWSWAADRVLRRNRPDLIVKDYRSQEEAEFLARFLDRVPPDAPVSLVGYSYGAQTIVGALKLLAGECFAGIQLERSGPTQRVPFRAVLVAGAMDSRSLASSYADRSPLSLVDRLLVTCNPCDPYLRLYPLLYKRHGPEAMGFVGPWCIESDNPDARKLEVIDVSGEVGKSHDWACYRLASSLASRWAEYAFLRSMTD